MAKPLPKPDTSLLNEATILQAVELANAGARIIQIRSHERERVRQLAQAIVTHPKSTRNFKYAHGWNASSAVLRLDNGKQLISHGEEGVDSLAKQLIADVWKTSHVWVLEDFHHFFSPQIDFKETVQAIDFLRVTAQDDDDILIILSGSASTIPNELLKDIMVIDLPLPDLPILAHIARECTGLPSSKIDEETLDAARGLTANEARRAFLKAWQNTGKLTGREATKLISQEKAQAIRGSNSLEFFDVGDCNLGQVGGMENIKKWLQKRKIGLKPSARKIGLEAPKGMLLLGVQGCGKSLLAKAVSQEWNMPLLRFDIGKVMGMWLGESEANMRAALQVAEAISPCVLWIDEIEKALAGSSDSKNTDGGTTVRIFGSLLTWMQEKKETVFVVATANSVLNLPPELLRKGRFDEIFFVDLPDEETRANIFDIHCSRRGHSIDQTDLKALAEATNGFSGAEIESCVCEGLYNWAEEGMKNNTFGKFGSQHIRTAIDETRPLSVLMSESILSLRTWAENRARPAAG